MERQNARRPDGSLGWFDLDKAEPFRQDTWWDGSNHISRATGTSRDHEALFHTANGQWVLNTYSRWQAKPETWAFIPVEQAREWLLAQNQDAAAERLIGPIEEETVPASSGAPEIGNYHHVPFGDLETPLQEYADSNELTFNGAVRAAVRSFLNRKQKGDDQQ